MIEDIENRRLVDYANVKNNADQITIFFAYIFDLYFDVTLKKLAENIYLEQYNEKVKQNFASKKIHKQSDYLLGICNEFINEKL